MNTEQQAQQLRLAADIIQTGHPFEYRTALDEWLPAQAGILIQTCPQQFLKEGIRLVLATPIDGRPLHNPDKLTAEQVGAGWRLCLVGEVLPKGYERWEAGQWREKTHTVGRAVTQSFATRRVPLSTPWPEAPETNVTFNCPPVKYPEIEILQKRFAKPIFTLPPPPPGMKWHREDGWKEGDLPQGYRPLTLGEKIDKYTKCCHISPHSYWRTCQGFHDKPALPQTQSSRENETASNYRFRTTRPLTFTHAGKEWTWHKPGDPMPCDGDARPMVLLRGGEMSAGSLSAASWDWNDDGSSAIIGWRYAEPATKTVPLGPEDVRCGDEILVGGDAHAVVTVRRHDITVHGIGPLSYDYLQGYKIRRHNSNAWEPCRKEVEA